MVDASSLSLAERDKIAIKHYNDKLKANHLREKRLFEHYQWRGNKLPPFGIEPMFSERSRLETQMTTEQRASRRQWLIDQELSPNEPRNIPELEPKNYFRRACAAPWNALFNTLSSVVGKKSACVGRYLLPRASMSIAVAWIIYYQMKYNPNQWTDMSGFHKIRNKPTLFPGDPGYGNPLDKAHNEFYDKGFKSRSTHLV